MESKMAALASEAGGIACRPGTVPVLVIGDCMLDSYVDGTVSRISPEAPVPVLSNPAEEQYAIGGAGNVAHNLHAMGNPVRLLAGIGRSSDGGFDGAGRELIAQMERVGLSSDFLVGLDRNTTSKQRVLAGKQQLLRIDREVCSPLSLEEERRALDAIDRALDGIGLIVVSDYAKGFLTDRIAERISDFAARNDILVLADLKTANLSKFTALSLLKPNLKEAQEFTGRVYTGEIEQVAGMAKELAGRFAGRIIVTCGGLGMILYDEGAPLHLRAQTKEVFDVSGAGDTTMAALAHGIIRGLSLEESASLAAIAAGVAVSKRGVVAVSIDDVRAELARKIVPKAWGHEEWIVNADYCGKKLVLNEGHCCSLHYHKIKDETFYIASGKVGFQLNDRHFIMHPGDSLLISPGTRHRFYGLENSEIFEFSTHHMEDDSYRDEASGTFEKEFFDSVPDYKSD